LTQALIVFADKIPRLYFTTAIGEIDLLRELSGVGNFAEATEKAGVMELCGFHGQVLSLPNLIVQSLLLGAQKPDRTKVKDRWV
jgi:hypothetical protein